MTNNSELIDLDVCVINALKLFTKKGIPSLNKINYKRPIILGSGNAQVTGKILFSDIDAVYADESNYIQKLNNTKNIDGAVIISASGGKHAPIIAQKLKSMNIETILFTNTENSQAEKIVNDTYVFEKNPEPYTYNTSTYLGMILAKTNENPNKILDIIENVKKQIPANLAKYKSFYFIIPNELENAAEMLRTKFNELFGPMIIGRIFTPEQTKHGKTVISSDNELFIGLGYNNEMFGNNRLNIKLPDDTSYATLISVGYYLIGNIQKVNPPYFKDNIEAYVENMSKIFNEKLSVIVE